MGIYGKNSGFMRYLKEIGKTEPLSQEQEVELAERIKQGDLEARDRLVHANLRFVVHIAKRYRNLGLPLDDLVNEGNVGLITAAERFDGSKGFKFISYAVGWVRAAILLALKQQTRVIRIPSNRLDLLDKIGRVTQEFFQKEEQTPSLADIAREIGVSEEEIRWTVENAQAVWSLDKNFDGEDGKPKAQWEFIADDKTPPPDAHLMEESVKRHIEEVLATTLEERQAETLRLYFGLGGERPRTLDEIAERWGVTREYARQIKEKALRFLRRPTSAKKLASAFDSHEPGEAKKWVSQGRRAGVNRRRNL